MSDDLEAKIDSALRSIREEALRAARKHKPMNSPHEAYAVILEEVDELWAEVKRDHGRKVEAYKEVIQIGAMAVRYLVDLEPAAPAKADAGEMRDEMKALQEIHYLATHPDLKPEENEKLIAKIAFEAMTGVYARVPAPPLPEAADAALTVRLRAAARLVEIGEAERDAAIERDAQISRWSEDIRKVEADLAAAIAIGHAAIVERDAARGEIERLRKIIANVHAEQCASHGGRLIAEAERDAARGERDAWFIERDAAFERADAARADAEQSELGRKHTERRYEHAAAAHEAAERRAEEMRDLLKPILLTLRTHSYVPDSKTISLPIAYFEKVAAALAAKEPAPIAPDGHAVVMPDGAYVAIYRERDAAELLTKRFHAKGERVRAMRFIEP